ncbi:hypothetical protein SAMN05216360_12418 [Methylobacterium phyllostachyos]|uniref:Uncharacterized protein n=1 Tax=Methylobacterium phyllostachyos TaxID=582672 RepID=A0A1H0JZ43_9HYPH|nr:hypothetical protein [Methylobacterium phyllostachyos]SDO48681.1 hypothetical protein SAMN05216360_12418 [Methylobacterium phyllostachyos]
MRTIFIHASAALISAAALTGPAAADERLHLTPPLYREQAWTAQQARRLETPTTTPLPVPPAIGSAQSASMARRSFTQASAETVR